MPRRPAGRGEAAAADPQGRPRLPNGGGKTTTPAKREAYLAADSAPVSFTTALMAKDLQLALDMADEAELPLTLTATAKESLDRACAVGFSDADFACPARLLRPSRPPV